MNGILIAALGNPLRGDDGFGARVIAALEQSCTLPPEVEVRDLGTPGAGLVDVLVDRRAVIFIDAVAAGEAGALHRLDRFPVGGSGSPHDGDIGAALELARHLGGRPVEVVLIGATGVEWDFRMELSAVMEAAVQPAVERVLAEVSRLGAVWRRR